MSSTELIERIAERASSGPAQLGHSSLRCEDQSGLVAEWQAVLGGAQRLRRRIRWGDVDLASLRTRSGAGADPTSDWQQFLQRSFRVLERPESTSTSGPSVDWSREPPFARFWMPMVDLALERAAPSNNWSVGGRDGLRLLLLRRLASTAELALYQYFKAFREAHGVPGSHDQFLGRLRNGGIETFLEEYACLARQLATHCLNFASLVRQLDRRLAADAGRLRRLDPTLDGTVIGVDSGLSDPHRGGRVVLRLRFSAGGAVFYKPRPVGLEHAFAQLVQWIQDRGGPAPAYAPAIAGDGYGWMPAVDAPACFESRQSAGSYFEAAGALTFLTYALRGSDLHSGNVLATDQGPVLVDAETLCSPNLDHGAMARYGRFSSFGLSHDRLRGSVISSGLLRLEQQGPEGGRYDLSGLGSPGGQRLPRQRRWRDVGTEALRPVWHRANAPAQPNRPTIAGRPAKLADFTEELRSGFEKLYRWFLQHRTELLAPDGPLEPFRDVRTRILARTSDSYASLLAALNMPGQQRLVVKRSLALEALYTPLLAADRRPEPFDLVAYEQRCIDGGDLPYFDLAVDPSRPVAEERTGPRSETTADSPAGDRRALDRLMGRLVCRPDPPWQAVVRNIEGLDEPDLASQSLLIETALHGASIVADKRPAEGPEADHCFDGETRISAASLSRRLDQMATWFKTNEPDPSALADQPLGASLYAGLWGRVLFFCEASRHEPATWQPLLDAALSEALALLKTRPEQRPGLLTGRASAIFALTHVARTHERPDLARHAVELALEPPQGGPADASSACDLDSGLAGWLTALCSLTGHCPTSDLFDAVHVAALELIARGRRDADFWTWSAGGSGTAGRVGMAHGNSGIALALARAFALTGHEPFAQIASAALAWEDQRYDEGLGDWPIESEGVDPQAPRVAAKTWCNGAPGLAVARAACAGAGLKIDQQALERALDATFLAPLGTWDHLCCGTFGVIDSLLFCGEQLASERLLQAARLRAAQTLSRAQGLPHLGVGAATPEGAAHGVTTASDDTEDLLSGSLWRGLSGIGLVVLRLHQLATSSGTRSPSMCALSSF